MKTITFRAPRVLLDKQLNKAVDQINKIDNNLINATVKEVATFERDVIITIPDELNLDDIFELGILFGKALAYANFNHASNED